MITTSRFAYFFSVLLFVSAISAQNSPAPSPLPSASLGSESVKTAGSLAVAFWNVQWFPGRRPNASHADEERQIRSVHQDLAQISADVIGFEEVRDFEHATVAIESLAGFKVDVCSNFPPREGQKVGQQVTIASRLQPMSAWAEAWKPGASITPPRGFAFAAYQLSPGQLLLVYAVHLKSNRGEIHEDMRIREESMHQLIAHMNAMNAAYEKLGAITWIVGGDFNTAPDEPRFSGEKTLTDLRAAGFSWSWEKIPASARITMPPDARFPAACFDHVFYRGASLRKAFVANTSPQSSDHRAVNVTVDLSEPPPPR